MKTFTELFNVYFLNALPAVGLVFLHFSFHKLFQPSEKKQSRFFLWLSFAWLANLAYLGFLDLSERIVFDSPIVRHVVVRCTNTISYFFFLVAAEWKLADRLPHLFNRRSVIMVSAFVFLLSLLALIAPTNPEFLTAPSVLLGIVAIAAVGVNYHIHFNSTPQSFGPLTKFSLVYSMYVYALLQLGVFLFPPFANTVGVRTSQVEVLLFLGGMLLKLVYIAGLSHYGGTVFSDYERKIRLVGKARLSLNLADQLAHELGTPAAELRVRAGALAEAGHVPPAPREMKAILNSLEQITGLLLVFNQFQRDQRLDLSGDAAQVVSNLNNICDAVIVGLKMTSRPDCRIDREYDAGPIVEGVQSELSQIVRNLVKNAIESVSDLRGGIGVVRVETEVSKEEGTVKVSISDNGPGIASDVFNTIFEDGVSTKGTHGRGHGLFIAKTLVEKYRGKIWAENVKKGSGIVGARVQFLLPLAASGQFKERARK